MKKLVILAVVVVAAGALYKRCTGDEPSPEAKTYEAFMKALRSTSIGEARALTTGDQAVDDIRAFTKREADRYRVRGSLTIHRALYTVADRTEDGGVLYLDILEELRVDPPGTTSAMGVANVWLRHEVEMAKVDGAWRVAAFGFEFEDAEGMDGVDVDDAPRWF
jgi:hypothetical protein